MIVSQYQVDAFTNVVFQGNPAAVCRLDAWLDDEVMQSIAAENNQAETAFFIPKGNDYAIRWFTPTTEVELCGHATLASAYVLFEELGVKSDSVSFDSLSGVLTVCRKSHLLEMDFPIQTPEPISIPDKLEEALGTSIVSCLFNQDYVAVLESEEQVTSLVVNQSLLSTIECRGVIATAKADSSSEYDFVCRFFGPRMGLDEDSVTGSAFTKLMPYWGAEFNQKKLKARQVSQRGGDVICELDGDRVKISGEAVLFSKSQVYLK